MKSRNLSATPSVKSKTSSMELASPEISSRSNGVTNVASSSYLVNRVLQESYYKITINGINAEQSLADCTGTDGTKAKTKAYALATEANSLIILGCFSNTASEYDENLPPIQRVS